MFIDCSSSATAYHEVTKNTKATMQILYKKLFVSFVLLRPS